MEKLNNKNWHVLAEKLGDKVMRLVSNESLLVSKDYVEADLHDNYLETEDGQLYLNLVDRWYATEGDQPPHPKAVTELNGAFVPYNLEGVEDGKATE